MKTRIPVGFLIIGIVAVGLIVGLIVQNAGPGAHDEFAQCLEEKGAIFYGAFWCPHCNDQKSLFGNSVQHLPYTECSTPDGKSQLQRCVDEDISSYPTWKFADGSVQNGVMTLEQLATKTGCSLEAPTPTEGSSPAASN
jgi:hypothetical protein